MSNNFPNNSKEQIFERPSFTPDPQQRALLEDFISKLALIKKGSIISARVTGEDRYFIYVDLGLKAEGKISKDEFFQENSEVLPAKDDVINVLLESIEDVNGNVVVSYSKALRQSKWSQLEQYFTKRTPIEGTVIRKIPGGCIVNILGVSTFLPKTHLIGDVKDVREILGKKINCIIIKMDPIKSNIVISSKSSSDMEILSNFSEGQVIQGSVKTISDSFALIELGAGILGKLHISEISWSKVENINDVLSLGQSVQVKITSISQGSRIQLSIKDLLDNPWLKVIENLNLEKGKVINGKIIRIEEKMIIIKIAENVEGQLKLSEMGWSKRNQNFNGLKEGQMIESKIIEINSKRNKVILSIKELTKDLVNQFEESIKTQKAFKAEVLQIQESEYLVEVDGIIDALIPKSSAYIDGTLKVGEKINVYFYSASIETNHFIVGTKKAN